MAAQYELLKELLNSGTTLNFEQEFFFKFYQAFILKDRWLQYINGVGTTLLVTAIALAMGVALGSVVALVRVAHDQQRTGRMNPVLGFFNAVCQVYTTIIRGTPMMVQLLIMSMVIFANSRNFTMVGALALGINSGAYVSEIIRGGLMAVDPGQMEAGRSLGLNYITTMVVIIIPQAIRAVLPALGNEFIMLLKDTSLITVIGGKELLYAAQGIMNRTYEAMFPLFGVALIYLVTAAVCFILGKLLSFRHTGRFKELYVREGFTAVALGWFVMSVFGAIPFVLTGEIPFYIDALFETISGFTTTGSSILSDVEALSYASLFWRSFTHWIGGMGVFVFIMAILPMMGGSTMNLMRAESPGPSVSKLVPRVRDTAKILYGLYMAITVLGVIMLCLCGMPLFDSLCTTFGSVGTGGFGVKNSSIGGYSPLIQNAVTILMILSGVNYTVYFCLLSRQFKEAFSIEEVRWYFLIIFASALTIAWNIRPLYATLGETLRHSFFQVGTIITTTGFATTDFNMWPQLSKTILLLLMMIGACAGSTGGGIKVSRVLILFKAIRKELSMMIHPRMVKKIKMDGHNLSHETLRSTNVYMTAYFIVLFVSLLIVCLDEYDLSTNFTA